MLLDWYLILHISENSSINLYNLIKVLQYKYLVRNGEQLSVSKLPKLKFLIQTGSYSMRGVYKFKNILNYAPEAYSSVKFEDLKAL